MPRPKFFYIKYCKNQCLYASWISRVFSRLLIILRAYLWWDNYSQVGLRKGIGFLCLKYVRMRIKYFISACLLSLENVDKSCVREKCCTQKIVFISISSPLNNNAQFLHTLTPAWQFFSKNTKKSHSVNWVDIFLPLFFLSNNHILMLISTNNGQITSYMFTYYQFIRVNLFKAPLASCVME